MITGRSLPQTGTDPFSYHTGHAYVRDCVEAATDASPSGMVDYAVYTSVLGWCGAPDKLKVVVETLVARLKLPSPACDKAIILAQAVPVPSLAPLLDPLKPHRDHLNPLIGAIAAHLHTAGEASKTEQAETAKKADEQNKWDTWSALYGRSKADWRGLPKEGEMGWGWWIAQDVGAQEWWCVAPKDEAKEGEGQ